MLNDDPQTGLGHVIALLAQHSARPRYAFLVLQLIVDAMDGRGCSSGRAMYPTPFATGWCLD
jgi:hypothetical protein